MKNSRLENFHKMVVGCIGYIDPDVIFRALADAMHDKTELELMDDIVTDESQAYLAELILQTSRLEKIKIGESSMTRAGMEFLCRALSINTTLREICIHTSLHMKEIVAALSHVIKANRRIGSMVIWATDITDGDMYTMCDALDTNRIMESIVVHTLSGIVVKIRSLPDHASHLVEVWDVEYTSLESHPDRTMIVKNKTHPTQHIFFPPPIQSVCVDVSGFDCGFLSILSSCKDTRTLSITDCGMTQ